MKSLYVITAPDGAVKVGISSDPERRSKALGRDMVVAHATDLFDQAERIETLAHRVLSLSGRQVKGEWFEATVEDAIRAIETAIEQAEGRQLPLGGEFRSGVGRPRVDDDARLVNVNLRLTREMVDFIDSMINEDRPTRSAVVRELLAQEIQRRKDKHP